MRAISDFFKNISPKQQKWIKALFGAFILLIVVGYLLVPVVAKKVIRDKIAEIEKERNVTLTLEQMKIAKYSIFGTFDLRFKELKVKDKSARESFARIHRLGTKVQVWKGFKRTLILKDLSVSDMQVHAVKRGKYCNYNFIHSSSEGQKGERNYQSQVNSWVSRLADFCPKHFTADRINVLTDVDTTRVRYTFENLIVENGKGRGGLVIQKNVETPCHWKLSGAMDKKKQRYEGRMVCDGKAEAIGEIPFLKTFKQMELGFHEATGHFSLVKTGKKRTECVLAGSIRNLQCQHHYLADVPVRIDSVSGRICLNVYPKAIEVDSTSTVSLNRATLHPYCRLSKNKSTRVVFKINERARDAEPLFASLPTELFQVLPLLKVNGKIDFNCLFDCDFGNVDSLKFDLNIVNHGRSFAVVEGLGEITRFNEQFEYTFYDNGEPVRNLWIGPNNPYFCPYHQIPELLKQAILASEDGAFFQHRGFIKSSMQSALVSDIKAGKMRRGGSTISMQLVKNLYLNRKKVLTRKFEEMALVWMIEDQRMMSKERMFEIYVNIIEWAPGVIGIGEAAEFYFHKRPSELTMPECIYLASLIRAPKHYASTLNADGTLTDVKRAELEFVADRMVVREFMTEAQRSAFDSNVKTVIRRQME